MINKAFQLGITINRDEEFVCDRSLNSDRFRSEINYQPPSWEKMIDQLASTSEI
jgi:dTDP-4-dehydrorhamnose reductase